VAPKGKTEALTVHPILSVAILGLHVSYEGALGQGLWAYEVPMYFGYSEKVYSNATMFLGSGLGLRRYVLEQGQGAYIEPELECLNIHRFPQGPDNSSNIVIVAPSLRMGYKMRWDFVTLDLGIGAGFAQSALTEGGYPDSGGSVRALFPMGNVGIGIPF